MVEGQLAAAASCFSPWSCTRRMCPTSRLKSQQVLLFFLLSVSTVELPEARVLRLLCTAVILLLHMMTLFLFFCSHLMNLFVSFQTLSSLDPEPRNILSDSSPLILGNIVSLLLFYNVIMKHLFLNSSSLHISRPRFISVSSTYSRMQAAFVHVEAIGTHCDAETHTTAILTHSYTDNWTRLSQHKDTSSKPVAPPQASRFLNYAILSARGRLPDKVTAIT